MKHIYEGLVFIVVVYIVGFLGLLLSTTFSLYNLGMYISIPSLLLLMLPYLLTTPNHKDNAKILCLCIISVMLVIILSLLVNAYINSVIAEYYEELSKRKTALNIIGVCFASILPLLIWLCSMNKVLTIREGNKEK